VHFGYEVHGTERCSVHVGYEVHGPKLSGVHVGYEVHAGGGRPVRTSSGGTAGRR